MVVCHPTGQEREGVQLTTWQGDDPARVRSIHSLFLYISLLFSGNRPLLFRQSLSPSIFLLLIVGSVPISIISLSIDLPPSRSPCLDPLSLSISLPLIIPPLPLSISLPLTVPSLPLSIISLSINLSPVVSPSLPLTLPGPASSLELPPSHCRSAASLDHLPLHRSIAACLPLRSLRFYLSPEHFLKYVKNPCLPLSIPPSPASLPLLIPVYPCLPRLSIHLPLSLASLSLSLDPSPSALIC